LDAATPPHASHDELADHDFATPGDAKPAYFAQQPPEAVFRTIKALLAVLMLAHRASHAANQWAI